MAKDPAFLFYSSDFLTGISFMNFEDRGKYITILCMMHQHGRLSEESICFAVASVSATLKKKFKVDEHGLWYNERLEKETEKRNRYTESRRNNGSFGGRGHKKEEKQTKVKSKKDKAYALHMDNHMEDENENRNEDINTNEIENSVSRKSKVKKPEKTPSAQKHGFRDSEYFEKEKFCSALDSSPPPYCNANADFYYDAALNGSDSKGYKYLDWMAAIKNWIRKDIADEKFKSKFSEPKKINGSSSKFDRQQQIEDHNADQLRRIMAGGLRNSGS